MSQPGTTPMWFNFATAGIGGTAAWAVVHPFNTASVRMNLHTMSGSKVAGEKSLGFFSFLAKNMKEKGVMSLYDGIGAGLLRQVFYCTARFGLFEVFRDELAKHRPTDIASRLVAGCSAGGIAALISCPLEVCLVRISNDANLPKESQRGYKHIGDAFQRILKEEGTLAFFRGCQPFVSRALLVGMVQVGTYDQFRMSFKNMGVTHLYTNVMYSSMMSGLLYSLVTNPFETAKNRMAFQKADPQTGQMLYRSTLQTIGAVAKSDGPLALWAGFTPYYLRCGGHTVCMFMMLEYMRKIYRNSKQ